MKLESKAFTHGQPIPSQFTCDGMNISPELSWSGVPDGTKSFALISDDPDASVGTWVHWVMWNIPADVTSLEADLPQTEMLPNGASQGINDFGRFGYGGPCPPGGTHRYIFKLYALDTVLTLPANSKKVDLLDTIEGHCLEQTELIGTYSRKR